MEKSLKRPDQTFRSVNSRRFHRKYLPFFKCRPARELAGGAGPAALGALRRLLGKLWLGKKPPAAGERSAAPGKAKERPAEQSNTSPFSGSHRWQRRKWCHRHRAKAGDRGRGRSGETTLNAGKS